MCIIAKVSMISSGDTGITLYHTYMYANMPCTCNNTNTARTATVLDIILSFNRFPLWGVLQIRTYEI